MKPLIHNVINASGIWKNGSQETHGFLLTPDVFRFAAGKRAELEALGETIRICVAGLARIGATAHHRDLAVGPMWNTIRRLIATEVPTLFQELQVLRPKEIPLVMKIDFIEDTDGHLWIGELDVMNRRAMGYATLFADIRRTLFPTAHTLPGIAPALAEEIARRGRTQATFLYSHIERFYRPEFLILQQALAAHEITLDVVDEMEVPDETGESLEGKLLVNFPIFQKRRALEAALGGLYRDGKIQVFVPPKPFLGSKLMLALLRNDYRDPMLEGILHAFIPTESLALIRQHIPPTYLVTGKEDLPDMTVTYVLKEGISAGAKGVTFSDNKDWEMKLLRARNSKGAFILQREVAGKQRSFRYYPHGRDELTSAEWYTRIVTFFVDGRPAEAVVTGCLDKRVHGGKDAVNMGVVFDEK